MTPRERIIKIQEYAGMSGMALSEYCGLKEDDLKSIRTNKTRKVSEKVANAIVNKFHELNKLWILTGEGEMLHSEHIVEAPTEEKLPNYDARINELLTICTMQQESINQLHNDIKSLVSAINQLVNNNYTNGSHVWVAEDQPNIK